jgi:hypothetical protein
MAKRLDALEASRRQRRQLDSLSEATEQARALPKDVIDPEPAEIPGVNPGDPPPHDTGEHSFEYPEDAGETPTGKPALSYGRALCPMCTAHRRTVLPVIFQKVSRTVRRLNSPPFRGLVPKAARAPEARPVNGNRHRWQLERRSDDPLTIAAPTGKSAIELGRAHAPARMGKAVWEGRQKRQPSACIRGPSTPLST